MEKEFVIEGLRLTQEKCAMKIGTDGVLLGRWATLQPKEATTARRVLDIGTGTGLLALLKAVRYPDTKVTAIDIDEGACQQAFENVARNNLQQRVEVRHCALQEFCAEENSGGYDMIICNPPYFQNSLKCPDQQRNLARHTDSLSFHDLMRATAQLLDKQGTISLIIPSEVKDDVDFDATLAGLFPSKIYGVKTSPKKPVRRYLLEFSKQPKTIDVGEGTINEFAP